MTDSGDSKEKLSQIKIETEANNPNNLKDLHYPLRSTWQQHLLLPTCEPATIFLVAPASRQCGAG